jgi:hypothetical protein
VTAEPRKFSRESSDEPGLRAQPHGNLPFRGRRSRWDALQARLPDLQLRLNSTARDGLSRTTWSPSVPVLLTTFPKEQRAREFAGDSTRFAALSLGHGCDSLRTESHAARRGMPQLIARTHRKRETPWISPSGSLVNHGAACNSPLRTVAPQVCRCSNHSLFWRVFRRRRRLAGQPCHAGCHNGSQRLAKRQFRPGKTSYQLLTAQPGLESAGDGVPHQ